MASKLTYTIQHAAKRFVAGLQSRVPVGPSPAIHALWARMAPSLCGKQSYGVCYDFKDGIYTYMAAVDVEESAPLPEGWVSIAIPEHPFAVYEHKGALDTISDTWTAITSSGDETWAYSVPCLEMYASNFKDGAPVTIWIPIVPKTSDA